MVKDFKIYVGIGLEVYLLIFSTERCIYQGI